MNWTKVWSSKYPILNEYQKMPNIDRYIESVKNLLYKIKIEYNLSETDAMLAIKDILYKEYLKKK